MAPFRLLASFVAKEPTGARVPYTSSSLGTSLMGYEGVERGKRRRRSLEVRLCAAERNAQVGCKGAQNRLPDRATGACKSGLHLPQDQLTRHGLRSS